MFSSKLSTDFQLFRYQNNLTGIERPLRGCLPCFSKAVILSDEAVQYSESSRYGWDALEYMYLPLVGISTFLFAFGVSSTSITPVTSKPTIFPLHRLSGPIDRSCKKTPSSELKGSLSACRCDDRRTAACKRIDFWANHGCVSLRSKNKYPAIFTKPSGFLFRRDISPTGEDSVKMWLMLTRCCKAASHA